MLDFIECVLFLREDGEGEVAVVGIAAGVALMLAAAGGFGTFGSIADGVASHPGNGIDEVVAEI